MMAMNTFLFATNISIFALCAVLFPLIPKITREAYLFGVRIPTKEQNSPEALQMKKRYRVNCYVGMGILIALCIVQFIVVRDLTILATLYLPLLILPVFFAAFIPNWKAATRLKAEQRWQVSSTVFADTYTARERGRLAALPWGWYIAGFAIITASVLIAIFRYPYLPDMIPTHFDINMQPTTWAETSWMMVLLVPLINTAMLLTMTSIAIMIGKAKMHVDQANPRLSFAQHRVYRGRLGHAFGIITATLILYVAAIGLMILFPYTALSFAPAMIWGGMIAIFIPIIAIVMVVVKSGQGGCKIKINLPDDESNAEGALIQKVHPGRGDDKYWKLGMFYYNPNDPACIIESRFGGKLSFNFARLPAMIVTALLALGLIATYVWVTIIAYGLVI